MRATMRWLTVVSLVGATAGASADVEVLYVAVGGSGDTPGAARDGDPARIAGRMRRSGMRVRLVDLTASRATAALARGEQLLRAVALRPTLVTIAVGPNDVRDGVPLRSFSRDLEIIADLLRRTTATVVVSTIPRAERLGGTVDRAFRRRVDSFRWTILRVARRHGFTVADVRQRAGRVDVSWEAAVAAAIDGAMPRPRKAPQQFRDATAAADRLDTTRLLGTSRSARGPAWGSSPGRPPH